MTNLSETCEQLEHQLDSFDREIRAAAIGELENRIQSGKIAVQPDTKAHNLHCHTFFSYNGYGFSPSHVAYLARVGGHFASGVVDFDVLDAVDEFLGACRTFNLRASAGIETRCFMGDLADVEINSPGEPGVAYHMGVGFTSGAPTVETAQFAAELRDKAAARTRSIVERVNAVMGDVAIDFERDAAALTPAGNVTERHVCCAYRARAEKVYPDASERAAFWSETLQLDAAKASALIADPVALEGKIRSALMKKGGVGYVAPDPASFPEYRLMNRFIKANGAIPCIAWLNGLTAGEADVDRLLDLHIAAGAAFLNIIPDRNRRAADPVKQAKLVAELDRVIEGARKRDMPVIAGTEMNAPGQLLVDDFADPALAKHLDTFVEGAAILAAHTMLAQDKMGYLSDYAKAAFRTAAEKNRYFADFGRRVKVRDYRKPDSFPMA